ncbi:MAG: PBP1A family penicillin-binding protein [Bdellovibrionales bacterium]|nr:PBP1A family penicillin-binding protein [Bdellovibrionales bacterium]
MFVVLAGLSAYVIAITSDLPKIVTVEDYEPLLVSEVFDRNNKKIGEFYRQKRQIAKIDEIPEIVKKAFIASEDSSFYDHGGINLMAIARAMFANLKAMRKVQGASTITQQVARSLLLSSEKTYTRKIKEIFLAVRMEENLSKDEILYLYLNQIYLGHSAYGVKEAAQVYFRKDLKDLTVSEAAFLGGLPQAPSRYNPLYRPKIAKNRQVYVINRLESDGYINEAQAKEAIEAPMKFYVRRNYKEDAPYFLETLRQMLVEKLGEVNVLDKGIKIYTSLDINKQKEAQKQVRQGLRDLDKRQGFRGPIENITDVNEISKFLRKNRDELISEYTDERILLPDGTLPDNGELDLNRKDEKGNPLPNLTEYTKIDDIVNAIVTKVDDKWGLVYLRFAESKGIIDIESMEWARKPDPKVNSKWTKIDKPSEALKTGDVIQVKIVGTNFYSQRIVEKLKEIRKAAAQKKEKYERPEDLPNFDEYAGLELEQEPLAQAALISFDQRNEDILAMVGGYDFEQSKYNRTYQATRQTGSAFKAIVYAAALDKNYTPSTLVTDAPIVFEEEQKSETGEEEEAAIKKWKPTNYAKRFGGDMLFRNALIHSKNVPTVKIIEDIGVDWVASYARRLGIFSPLNMDLTLALGSSGVTLYEMTKAFSQFGRLGKRIEPKIIHKVLDKDGNVLWENVSFDERFKKELDFLNDFFENRRSKYLEIARRLEAGESLDDIKLSLKEKALSEEPAQELDNTQEQANVDSFYKKIFNYDKEPPLYFSKKGQLMKPETAYVITSILQGVIEEGTGRGAKSLGRPAAGKTGTTSEAYDAWFVGYTPDIATGVWVGFDDEKTLGAGEGGGRTALPIWLEYMKFALNGVPARNFNVPEGIVFANIDNESGQLASSHSENIVRQAFIEGTEPTLNNKSETQAPNSQDVQDFYKEDLSQ